ncbi:MAG: PAS domain-containing protein [Holophagales bacterium]|nr:PAS domain-containing protein [Holophagales bacterium]
MKPAVPRRARPAVEALVLGAITVGVVGLEPRAFVAGALVGTVFFVIRLRRMRELDRVRDGVATAAAGTRPEEWRGLSPETEPVFHALHRFADLVAQEREGSEKARVLARTVFVEVPVGLVVVDRALAVLDVNPAARLLFGVPPDAYCPALHDVVRDPMVLGLFRSLTGAGGAGDEAPSPVVVKVDGREGGERLLEVTARAVPGAHLDGEPAAIGVARDVTERERTERMRRQFVADVSHELRTPLATIRAAAETLAEEESLDEAAARLAAILERQAGQMQDLVSDLTDLSQIESGAVTLQLEEVPLQGLLAGVVKDLESVAKAKRVEVTLEARAGLAVRGDRRRLAQVFRNLVDNAVKFSPAGARVEVVAEAGKGPAAGEVFVHVIDRGIGIPASEQAKVFQRFYRVDPSRSKATPGTGLGLAIVKHLLILHGGSIRVESEPLRGSRFTVALPTASAADLALKEAS